MAAARPSQRLDPELTGKTVEQVFSKGVARNINLQTRAPQNYSIRILTLRKRDSSVKTVFISSAHPSRSQETSGLR